MSALAQAYAVTAMNLRSLPSRTPMATVVVVGVAVVVTVLICVLAMAEGFTAASAKNGRADRVIVLAPTAESETGSGFARTTAVSIADMPGIKRTADGKPIVSAEHLAFLPLTDRRTGLDTMMTLRGVGTEALALRPEMQIVEGRMFHAGVNELIVGRAASARLDGVTVGSETSMPRGEWTVVGIFDSGGDARDSELLMDADTLIAAVNRGDWFTSVTAQLESEAAFDEFKNAVTTNPSLTVKVERESVFRAAASEPTSRLLRFIAYVIGGAMALGAVFAVLNTAYTVVSRRTVEIATLRALGFGAGAVVTSVLVEVLLLALLGAVLGVLFAYFVFHGNAVSTMSGTSPSQITYALIVTPGVAAAGMLCACTIGLIGGLFPAVRAARLPVAIGLRAA